MLIAYPCRSPPPSSSFDENTDCAALKEWRDKAQCYFVSGRRYDQRGETTQAVRNYNRSIAVDPRVFHSPGRNPCHCSECDPGYRAFPFDSYWPPSNEIVDHEVAALAPGLEEAVKKDPNYAVAWLRLAHLYSFVNYHGGIVDGPPIRTPAFDRAVVDFSKAIELDPDYEMAWSERGIEYLRAHDFDKALHDFTKAIELDPTDYSFWKLRAITYESKGDFDRAKADFSKIIEMRPNEPYSWMGRAKLYEKMGDQEKSDADYCKAASVDVNNGVGMRFWLTKPVCQPK